MNDALPSAYDLERDPDLALLAVLDAALAMARLALLTEHAQPTFERTESDDLVVTRIIALLMVRHAEALRDLYALYRTALDHEREQTLQLPF